VDCAVTQVAGLDDTTVWVHWHRGEGMCIAVSDAPSAASKQHIDNPQRDLPEIRDICFW
jgi:hypothetical protein